MAGPDDKVPGYRRPHDGPQAGAASEAPREALGRLELPVVGPLDLDLALGRPLRLRLDADGLQLEPGAAVFGRLPGLPALELRRLRLDLVHGTVDADADGLGPFELAAAGVAVQVALRRGLDWQPGRSVLDLLAQNLPCDPATGARRLWAGPLGASAWLRPDAALAVELHGDRLEVALGRPAVLRALGLSLPILAVRLLFGPARLEIDPGEAGLLRRAILRVAAWLATRWLRRRVPAAMMIPGYDLLADEQRRARLLDLVRRLRGRPARRRRAPRKLFRTGPIHHPPPTTPSGTGSDGHAPPDPSLATDHSNMSSATGSSAHGSADTFAARLARVVPASIGAASPPPGARVLWRLPLPGRGELALVCDEARDPVLTRAGAGVRLEIPGGLYLHADELPELAGLRLAQVHLAAAPPEHGAPVRLDLHTDPPLGALARALVRKLVEARLLPRLDLALLRRLGLADPRPADALLVLQQDFSPTAGIDLRAPADAEVRLRHGAAALLVEAPAGLQIRFRGLPYLPDATLRRLEYRWADGAIAADTTPALGDFGALALARLVRVHAVPVLPAIFRPHQDHGPGIDPGIEQEHPFLLVRTDIPVVGRLDVRIDPADVLAVRLAPRDLALASSAGVAVLAPDLRLALRLRRLDHRLDLCEAALHVEPAVGDYLTALVARCLEHFGLVHLRPRLPLAPDQLPEETWRLAQVPKDSSGPRARLDLPPGAGLVLERRPDALELRAEAPLQITPEGTALLAEFAVEGLRYRPGAAALELASQPPAGALTGDLLRRLFARFVPRERLADLLRRLALPAPAPVPPPRPAAPGVVVWERAFAQIGAVKVALDPARTVHLSLQRSGARIALGKGASLRVLGLGFDLVVRGLDLTFFPWTVELDTTPTADELGQHLIGQALRALFAEFMRYFWPRDRAPRAGHDTLLALGEGKPWGPLKICVAKGGAIDLHLDRDGLSLKSAAGLFVSGEAIDWLPDFYLHELSLRFADTAVKLAISGIVEQAYREAAPVSPVTEAVLSHLYRVLVAPRLPAVWAQRLGLPRPPLPPVPPPDPTRLVVFEARLPGDYGDFVVSIDPTDVLTITANEIEVAVESEKGFQARMPGLRLELKLRGARYHLETGEVQVGGLGQLENALVEALIRRSIPGGGDPAVSGVRAVVDRFPVDDQGRRVLFTHPHFRVLLQPGTSIRLRLDDTGLKIGVEPSLLVDGLASANFVLCGLCYDFDSARFSLDLTGDSALASLIEGLIDKKAEKEINDRALPLLPAAMRTPGYRLSRDPDLRATLGELIRTLSRRKRGK